jgi:hypothetical protein
VEFVKTDQASEFAQRRQNAKASAAAQEARCDKIAIVGTGQKPLCCLGRRVRAAMFPRLILGRAVE